MIKAITIEDDEQFLRQISKPVDLNDAKLKHDIKILDDYCKENDVLAMAAVQLGIPKRIVYLKNTNLELVQKEQYGKTTQEDKKYNEQRVLINPVIIKREGLTDYWEACKSCLNNMGHVQRPYKITIQYQDIKGETKQEIFE